MKPRYSKIKTSIPNLKLDFLEMKAAKPGSTIFLTGCIHGDEGGGTIIIKELFKKLQQKKLLKGTLYALPILNPLGFKKNTRGIGKNNEDLNRAFPGNPKGTMAEKLADTIFTEIKQINPDLVLDIHNDWLNTIPYVEIDPNPGSKNAKGYRQAKILAAKLGLPVVNELKQSALAQKLHKSLSGSLLRHNLPALTLEIAGSNAIFTKENLADGVLALWNLLTYLGMVEPQKKQFHFQIPLKYKSKILIYSQQPTASKKGFIKFLVRPGAVVKKGQPVVQIFKKGKIQETLYSRHKAIILGHADSVKANPGDALISFGIL